MPPRGNEALDFTPILTHYLFLFTSILSVVRSPFATSCVVDRALAWLVHSFHLTNHLNRPMYASFLLLLLSLTAA